LISIALPSGNIALNSSLSWTYRRPLVQITRDAIRSRFLLTTFIGDNTTVFFLRQDSLTVVNKFETTTDAFFDLQHNNKQDAIYGIHVENTYGRVLSNFSSIVPPKPVIKSLFTLELFWYVNASALDSETGRYFAILNNFTGTTAQKLVVADFSSPSAVVNTRVFDLYDWLVINFIAWSPFHSALFGLAYRQTSTGRTPFFVGFDLDEGRWVPLEIVGDRLDSSYGIGPVICDEKGHMFAFIHSQSARAWILYDIDMTGPMFHMAALHKYEDELEFAAIAYAPAS